MSNYAERLKKLQGAWEKDKAVERTQGLPAGKYQWIISKAILNQSKAAFNNGYLVCRISFCFVPYQLI